MRLYEAVTGMAPDEKTGWRVFSVKHSWHARAVIVATGFYDTPRLLGVPGEELPKVKHYYDDAHLYAGQKVLVIGAANSACDAALETWNKVAEVTMVIRESEIYSGVKYWIRPNIENRIKEGSIKAWFNYSVLEILHDRVTLQTPEGKVTLENDFVLAMTGYQPDFAFLEKLGIQFNADEQRTPVMNPETFESNLPGVYLAGVVQAGLDTSKLFIENTRHHGEVIVREVLSL